jgi:hypothetical protein
MKRVLLVPVLFVSTFVFCSGALAAPTLDQFQESQNSGVGLSNGIALAQTFTAGLSGTLDHVQIGFNPLAYPTTVEIRQTVGGMPTGTLLGSVLLDSDFGAGWRTADFSSLGISITSGTEYAFVVWNDDASFSTSVYVQWDGASYPSGQCWLYSNGAWEPMCDADCLFRTYVNVPEPIPVPGAALLGVLGTGLVGYFRKRKSA